MRQAVRSILAETYRFFSQSRRDNRAAELLLLRIRARGETFGLSCVVSAICRARPLWPSAPRMGNWLPCNGGRPQGPHPARGSESTRIAYFRAKRATASISREESWKVVAKIFMLLLCDLGGLARKKHLAAVALLSQSRRGRKDFARGWQGGNGRLRGKRVKNSETGPPLPGSEE